jgi:hypothetical protein
MNKSYQEFLAGLAVVLKAFRGDSVRVRVAIVLLLNVCFICRFVPLIVLAVLFSHEAGGREFSSVLPFLKHLF